MTVGAGIAVLAVVAWALLYAAATIGGQGLAVVLKLVCGLLSALAALGSGALAANTVVGSAAGWVIGLAEGIRIGLMVLLILGTIGIALVLFAANLGKAKGFVVLGVVASWLLAVPALSHGLIQGATGASITDAAASLAGWVLDMTFGAAA